MRIDGECKRSGEEQVIRADVVQEQDSDDDERRMEERSASVVLVSVVAHLFDWHKSKRFDAQTCEFYERSEASGGLLARRLSW